MGHRLWRLSLAALLAVFTGLTAQVSFSVGPVPFTMQNAGVALSGLLLPPGWALVSQLAYLLLIAAGAPLAAGLKGGAWVLVGLTGGYLAGFPVAALLTSLLRRSYERLRGRALGEMGRRDLAVIWALTCVSSTPIYLLGYLVFAAWVAADPRLALWSAKAASLVGVSDPAWVLPVAAVLIFIPEDFLVDHTVAVLAAWSVARILPREYSVLNRSTP
ncbi:MAG: biotin transporter BioY [Infirmifilum sp.]